MSEPVYASRIYVGNIDFRSTPEELSNFFDGLSVQSAEIPSKTIVKQGRTFDKCLGFAFVQFSTEEDAEKAVQLYNDKEFKLRTIYVKKALPPASEEEKQAKKEAYELKKKELRKKRKSEARAKAAESKANGEGKADQNAAGKENSAAGAEGSQVSDAKDTEGLDKKGGARKKAPEGAKSKDTIFITNLEFRANSKSLGALFKDYDVVWASVPTRRVPPHVLKKITENKEPIFNKGFAFVKFKSEEDQLRAVEEFNGKDHNGRELVVEVAVEKPEDKTKPAKKAASSPESLETEAQ